MSVMAETPPRPLESLTDAEMNMDKGNGGAPSKAVGTGLKRKAPAALSSSTSSSPATVATPANAGGAQKAAPGSIGSSTEHATPASKKVKTANTPTALGASSAAPQQTPQTPSLVQLKNGRLVLRQKQVEWSRSMSALQAIIAFNQWLEEEDEPIAAVPDEHLGMVAMLTQESDKTLPDLAKSIKKVVVPSADLDGADSEGEEEQPVDLLPLSALTAAINAVAARTNYGIDTVPSSSTNEVSVPAALQMWRWEVRDMNLLASENRDKIAARREERQRAREEASGLLDELPEDERKGILSRGRKIKPLLIKSEGGSPAPTKERQTAVPPPSRLADADDDDVFVTPPRPAPKVAEPQRQGTPVSPSKSSASRQSPLPKDKAISPEHEARSAEKEERRREREAKKAEKVRKEAEKEAKKLKVEQAKKRAASFMSSFMQRPRSASPTKPVKDGDISDFDRAFPPCNYKDMASTNRFARKLAGDVADTWDDASVPHASLLSDLKGKATGRVGRKPSRKGIHPPISVRDSMRLITEASVLGDGQEGKRGLANLADRKRLPIKLLHFHTDRRPAWYGTWTRSTNFVSPRRPLGQDPVALDYTYDSDAEWEEVDPFDGDDVQENEKDDDDNDSQGRSDSDSEMDDWLVDDLEVDEEEEQDHAALKDSSIMGSGPPLPGSDPVNELHPKQKAKKYKPIGRRFEAKLVKFETGPHWESELGVATYDGFRGYQMEFLSDASFGINPFTYTSAEPAVQATPASIATSGGGNSSVAHQVGPLDTVFKSTTPTSKDAIAPQTTLDRARAFPENHLGELLRAIEGSTSIRSVLLEDLKQKFGGLGNGKTATKACIDACVQLYAERSGRKAGSKWVVKPEYRATAGL